MSENWGFADKNVREIDREKEGEIERQREKERERKAKTLICTCIEFHQIQNKTRKVS